VRGLSGAVTALILVVASVVIALIVVGFAFNLFGAFSSTGAVTTAGSAYLYTSQPPGITFPGNKPPQPPQPSQKLVYLLVPMSNKGSNINITSAMINQQIVGPYKVYIVYSNTQQPKN